MGVTRQSQGSQDSMKTVIVLQILLAPAMSDNFHSTLQAPSAGSGQQYPTYPEYPDYGYASSGPGFASELDRQGLEAVLGAPVVITAFAAALFGGLLSPLISSGLSRMADLEIEWPEVKQKVDNKTKTTKNRTKLISKARQLVSNFSWIEALETLNSFAGNTRYKRSSHKFNKYLAQTLKEATSEEHSYEDNHQL